ncbi:unnamed protein product [Paramecium octaurelia]|uniref:Uncharacterized protein n=1 Tax=Paramecium octaurelia TaxID=43137 RepID=A0A8S1WVK5_PAROT|nr:unnamed protein product [Paramecium octaurelia]
MKIQNLQLGFSLYMQLISQFYCICFCNNKIQFIKTQNYQQYKRTRFETLMNGDLEINLKIKYCSYTTLSKILNGDQKTNIQINAINTI